MRRNRFQTEQPCERFRSSFGMLAKLDIEV
jgi:hypothetical protein